MNLLRTPFTVVDGGLSTALGELGRASGGLLWTAQLVIDEPDVVVAAHRSFVEAGAEVIITSSYQASVAGFEGAGLSRSEAVAALRSTTDLARRAVDGDADVVVAASIGPFGATLGDGSEYHGRYDASWDAVQAFHRERIAVIVDSGPDLIAVETIPGIIEAEIILDELDRVGAPAGWLTLSCRDGETTCAGDPFAAVVRQLELSPALVAIGVNCTAPNHVESLLRSATGGPLPFVVYPNHGRTWDAVGECWIGDGDDHLSDRAAAWVAAGARLIGGCCGVGPAGVRGLVATREALASEG
jgi:homocysteine S-methyltransferase